MQQESYPAELLESMDALSRLVTSEETVESTVARICELAVHAIPSVDICSSSLARRGKITTVAATDDIARVMDQIQYDTGQGPCLSSIEERATFLIADMHEDQTWPEFSKRAATETEIRCLLAFVLQIGSDALGALNLISLQPDAFDDDDQSTGAVFASQAAVALANALTHEQSERTITELEGGMHTRQVVGQAIGILMASRHVDSEAAFDILKRISQRTNVKLRDISQQLVKRANEIT